MRHIFVINPLAGKKGKKQKLEEQIRSASERLGEAAEIYETRSQGDGERFVRTICQEKEAGENIRFYACGGDGALNEVVNGAVGFEGVEVGCVPLGTGNDYVRNYATPQEFLDIEAQLRGQARSSDLIRYEAERKGQAGESRYCVNMFNIGFDCNVVDQTSRAKNWPLVKGSFAYLLSVAIILVKKKGADLKVFYEDGSAFDGKLLLIAVANGCYCGGGVKGLPLSKVDDGLMDVSLIKNVPRRTFIRLFPKYAKGTHLADRKAPEIIDYRTCRRLKIWANQGLMKLCVDGEIIDTEKVTFEIAPRAMSFSVPAGV